MFGLLCKIISLISNYPSPDINHLIPSVKYPREVWMYYEGKMPEILQIVTNHSQQILSEQWNVHFLTENTVEFYLKDRCFPETYHLYTPQAQSDYIRLHLLRQYGGWWIDASSNINSDVFMELAIDEVANTNAGLFGYCFEQCPRMVIESNVLYAPARSPLLVAWSDEYWKALNLGREKYIYEAFRSGVDMPKQIFPSYPKVNPYWTVYATERVAISRKMPRNLPIITKDAKQYIYKLYADCKWDSNCTRNGLKAELVNPRYQITKLTSAQRAKTWPGSQAKSRITGLEPNPPCIIIIQRKYLIESDLLWKEIYWCSILLFFISPSVCI